MENCKTVFIALVFVVGIGAGAILTWAVMSSQPASPLIGGGISSDSANKLVLEYWPNRTVPKDSIVAINLDTAHLSAMNSIIFQSTAPSKIAGFRLYRVKSDLKETGTVLVAVDDLGKDLFNEKIFFVDKRFEPCPTICDYSSPIIKDLEIIR
jgi:hypothetical protein